MGTEATKKSATSRCAAVGTDVEVLGLFVRNQAGLCRDLLHKLFEPSVPAVPVVFIGPCRHDERTGKHELLDDPEHARLCEWGLFRTPPDDDPELVEVFSFYSCAAEALRAVTRYYNLLQHHREHPLRQAYSLAEVRAASQMLQWAQIAMFSTDDEPERSRTLLALALRVGHQAFRDIFIKLAPVHAEAQDLGMRENGITDYNRSHDNQWTMCFMLLLTDITETGIGVRPDWKEKASHLWGKFKEEMERGIYPDFDPEFPQSQD